MATNQELASRFEALGPWTTKFIVDDETYGGTYDAASDERVTQFHEAFPDAATIIELGSFEGGHTAALARLPGVERIVGYEGRIENVERARFALDALGVTNVEIRHANLEELSRDALEPVDAVFNCGLLYHLPRPWELLSVVARITPAMYLSTHYCQDAAVEAWDHGFPGYWYHEFGYEDRLSGLAATSYWPTRQALLDMLATVGFKRTEVTSDDPGHDHGALIAVACRKGRSGIRPTARRVARRLEARWRAFRQ